MCVTWSLFENCGVAWSMIEKLLALVQLTRGSFNPCLRYNKSSLTLFFFSSFTFIYFTSSREQEEAYMNSWWSTLVGQGPVYICMWVAPLPMCYGCWVVLGELCWLIGRTLCTDDVTYWKDVIYWWRDSLEGHYVLMTWLIGRTLCTDDVTHWKDIMYRWRDSLEGHYVLMTWLMEEHYVLMTWLIGRTLCTDDVTHWKDIMYWWHDSLEGHYVPMPRLEIKAVVCRVMPVCYVVFMTGGWLCFSWI